MIKKENKLKDNELDDRRWEHAGGKFLEMGAETLSDAELLSIIIGTGVKGKSAESIANEIMIKFGSFYGMTHQPFEKFLEIKGLGETKIVRIAAAFEIAKRIVDRVIASR